MTKQKEKTKGMWIIWILTILFFIWLFTTVPRDSEKESISITNEISKPQIFALVNYTHQAEHEFRCEYKSPELELNRTKFGVLLFMYNDREVNYFESDEAIYRVSMPEMDIWHNAMEEDEDFKKFKEEAIQENGNEIVCWSYLLPHELGLKLTYYDEGYAEGPFPITNYDRMLYTCWLEEEAEKRWECEWKDDGYRGFKEYEFPIKIYDVIEWKVTSE